MPDDTRPVDVPIPVETTVASALDVAATRTIAGRLVSRMLPPASVDRLFQGMDAPSADADQRGFTDAILQAELAARDAERQDTPPA